MLASANKLVDGTIKRAGTYLLHTYLIETNGCCVDGKITFANQQVLEEGHSRLHEKGSDDMDRPCRPGLCHGSDLRSGMGQGGTGGLPSNIKSTVRHGRAATFQSTVGLPCWGTAVPAICQVIDCTCTCLGSACTTTAPQRKRGTATELSLARAPSHAILQQSRESQISLLPTHCIASHRITPRSTHPSSISDLLCCQCSTWPDRMQPSSGVGAAIAWRAPHYNFSSLPTVSFLASRISHHTPADSTIYVSRRNHDGQPPSTGISIHHLRSSELINISCSQQNQAFFLVSACALLVGADASTHRVQVISSGLREPPPFLCGTFKSIS